MRTPVAVLATGGTIATQSGEAGGGSGLSAVDVMADFLDLDDVEILAHDVLRVPSSAVSPLDMWTLAGHVRRVISEGARGVIITHGTDTLEETAYALSLMVQTPVPVIVTGSMRVPYAAGADGAANLGGALRAALTPELAAYGPVVVMHDEVHVARWVTKTHSTKVAGFSSPGAGPVGCIVEDVIHLRLGPAPGADLLDAVEAPRGRVELIWAVAGADGLLVEAAAEHADGFVVAGMGGGHLPPALAEALVARVHAGQPVVLSSRCGGSAEILRRTYSGVGSETHLLAEGVVSAGALSPVKSRLRLLFGLAAGMAPDVIFAPRRPLRGGSPTLPA